MNNTESYAFITGASSGIGKAIALELASRSKNLLLLSLPNENLAKIAQEIEEKFQVRTDYIEIDLTHPDGPKDATNWVINNKYSVDFLINNAGIAGTVVFEKSDDKYIDDRILLNIRALTLLSRNFIQLLRIHKESYILNVSSMSAFFSIPFKSVYSSSKAYVLNFSKAIHTELKGSGISVSVLCPNGVYSNQGTYARIESHGSKAKLTSISAEKIAEIAINKTLAKKFLIIPGRFNRFLCMIRKIIPSFLEQKILYHEFQKEVEVS